MEKSISNHLILRVSSLFLAVLCVNSLNAAEDVDWPLHGLTAQEQRFSPLSQINDQNAAQLGLAWSFDTDYKRGLEATPIVVDGVMFVTGNWSVVYALNARTGEQLWKYDPMVPKSWGAKGCCDVVNRGVAVADGKVLVGTFDARLIALDAKSGTLLWETQTADIKKWPYTITGAPRVAKGKVFIGNGGAEYGVRGFIAAYDLTSGEQVWKFYTVPGNPADGLDTPALQEAAKTWKGQWWKIGGGGTVWDSIVYDEELDQLYFGVGNGTPWDREQRSPGGGDNLYLNSIVAVNPDNGEYIWHYQETPADNWDFTSTQPIMLAEMPWQGEDRKVIWHAPKNGFFFVIDRETGIPLSIEPYTTVNWATHYDKNTWRPVETPEANYQDNPGTAITPSSLGAHNWFPMAHSPDTGLVYIPVKLSMSEYVVAKTDYIWGGWNIGVEVPAPPLRGKPTLIEKMKAKLFTGYLLAWNPQTQSEVWRLEHATGGNGGVLATAGNLVLQGTSKAVLNAVSADKGEILWSYDTQVGVMAAPVTYMLDGEQYIAVAVGWGGALGLVVRFDGNNPIPPSRILVFKLGATESLPSLPKSVALGPVPPRSSTNSERLDQGFKLYSNHCSVCHGAGAASSLAIPDLRNLPMAFYSNFDGVVRGGLMENKGMPKFDKALTEDQVKAIYAYVLDEANVLREEQEPSVFDPVIDLYYELLTDFVAWVRQP